MSKFCLREEVTINFVWGLGFFFPSSENKVYSHLKDKLEVGQLLQKIVCHHFRLFYGMSLSPSSS